MGDISPNTKLEIAVEIMAAKIAETSRKGYAVKDKEMQQLIDERNEMYIGNLTIIEKIIKEYAPELKDHYNDIEGE